MYLCEKDANPWQSFLEPLADQKAARSASAAAPPDAVWPLPLERTVSYGGGTAAAPAAIVRAGAELERYDEELAIPIDWNVGVLPALEDRGSCMADYLAQVETTARSHYRSHSLIVALGGEHTVSIPLLRAASDVFGSLGVLHIDAHADLRSRYQGQSLSHACVMHHLRAVTQHTVSVGIRSLSAAEAERIQAEQIPVVWAKDVARLPDDRWIERVLESLPERVYVTIDLDGFDPSVVPGVGTPEPGGLMWYPALNLLRRVAATRRIVAADIVEGVPLSGAPVTEYAAARLALKLMVYLRTASSTSAVRAGR